MIAELTQPDLNTYGLGALTLAGAAYGLYQKIRNDRTTEAAKLRGDTITELRDTIVRQDAEFKSVVERKDREIAAEVAEVARYRELYTNSERERAAQVTKTREALEAEEVKQTQIRHELRAEMRAQSAKIFDLESENRRLQQESDRLRQDCEHQRTMIMNLTERIAAIEAKGAGIVPVVVTNRADQAVPVASPEIKA